MTVKQYPEGSNLSFGIFSNCLEKQQKGQFCLGHEEIIDNLRIRELIV
jgi:hypothetical protein